MSREMLVDRFSKNGISCRAVLFKFGVPVSIAKHYKKYLFYFIDKISCETYFEIFLQVINKKYLDQLEKK